MRSITLLTAAAVLSLAATAAGSASASPFTNGDFTQPGSSFYGAFLNPTFLPGWTYASPFGLGDIDEYQANGTYGLTPSGGHPYVSFGGNSTWGGSLTQTFDTTPGQSYTLSYQVGEIQGADPSQDMRATLVNGGTTLVQDFVPGSLDPVPELLNKQFVFTAEGSSATITFFDATPPGGGGPSNLALANVSFSGASAAPEPAAWALMILGLGQVGGALRRRARPARAAA